MKTNTTISLTGIVCVVGLLYLTDGAPFDISESAAAPLGQRNTIRLGGTLRDFTSVHPDFGITNASDMGHYAKNVAPSLDLDGLPMFVGSGRSVDSQWFDKDGHPIAPYGDQGLFGGHFDVDVYDSPSSTQELYHEHQFDDECNCSFIDIANDCTLLFDSVIRSNYPNDVRVEMINTHNGGGGTFSFQPEGGTRIVGYTADGFEAVFDPNALAEFQVNFMSLDALRPTSPSTSQDDPIDRDDAFSVRVYDVITDELVYEIAVYHHFKPDEPASVQPPTGQLGDDVCGSPINDTVGVFGAAGSGKVTSAATFGEWFQDTAPVNMSSMPYPVTLTRNPQGDYEYISSSFYPADGQMYGNDGESHNNNFTYTISATFIYNACTNLFFEFEGSDDAWVFIDNQLALDIGGVATPSKQYIALDRMNLVDGQEYTLNFFYAQRREAADSIFRMRTNIEFLINSVTLPTSYSLYD